MFLSKDKVQGKIAPKAPFLSFLSVTATTTISVSNELSIDEPLNVDWDGNELLLSDILGSDSDSVNRNIEMEDEKNQLLKIVSRLNEREKQIMTMRFGLFGSKEYTQKQVADLLGISQSYISRLEKRIIEKIKTEMQKAM